MNELERLRAENARLREWIEPEAYCPCCEGTEECAPDCTFSVDAPAEHERIVAVREVLKR